jgi:hypothetical protein
MSHVLLSRRFYLQWFLAIIILPFCLIGAIIFKLSGDYLSHISHNSKDKLVGKWKSRDVMASEDIQFTREGEVTLLSSRIAFGDFGAPSNEVRNLKGTYKWIDDKTIEIILTGPDNQTETITMGLVINSGFTRASDELLAIRKGGSTISYRRNE